MPVGSAEWLDAANSELLTSKRGAHSTATIEHVRVSMVKTIVVSSIIAASGFAQVRVSDVVVQSLEMLDEGYLSKEFSATCNASHTHCEGSKNPARCKKKRCAARDCQLTVPRNDQGGVIRVSRTLGIHLSFDDCLTSQNSSDLDKLQLYKLPPAGLAYITGVTMRNCTLLFYAVHVTVRDYP